MDIDILLKTNKNLDELSLILGQVLGSQATAHENAVGRRFIYRAMDIEFVLVDADLLENVDDVPFEDYSSRVAVIKLDVGIPIAGYEPMVHAVTDHLAERLARTLACETRVVYGLSITHALFGSP